MPNIVLVHPLERLRTFTNGPCSYCAYVAAVPVESTVRTEPPRPHHVVVIGAGISGLAAAEALHRRAPNVHVTVVEASGRSGGIISSERVDGFVLEHGPDVAVAFKPAAVDLAKRVGIAAAVIPANPVGAFVVTEHGLRRLPAGTNGVVARNLRALRQSDILTPGGFLRAALEPFVAPRLDDEDESIESFAVRRIGKEAYHRITEPLLTGIVAGDGAKLSMMSMFPQLRSLERQAGSVSRGVRLNEPNKQPVGPPTSPFVTFRRGMSELPEAVTAHLAQATGVTLRYGTAATRISHSELTAEVQLASGERIACDAVIVATPARVAASLLSNVSQEASTEIAAIPHVSTAVVTLAFHAADVAHPLDGTGYVVPRYLRRDALACTWSSSKIDGRAPEHMRLLRVFLGGAQRPELPGGSDEQLISLARQELQRELAVVAAPHLTRVTRWAGTMPQYHVGHRERICRVDNALESHAWLALAGNAYRGVGIPDCIASGVHAAERVLKALPSV